jgi:hypothetical protein
MYGPLATMIQISKKSKFQNYIISNQRYGQQLAELQSLSTAIESLRRKQKYYDSLLSLAEETLANPTVNVQPNLVTKTGPIADELRKMRTLLAKVTDHLNNANITLRPDDESTEPREMEVDNPTWEHLSRIIEQANHDSPQQS